MIGYIHILLPQTSILTFWTNNYSIFTFIPITLITITRIEEEWAIMASKYRYGINIDKVIKDELIEFI